MRSYDLGVAWEWKYDEDFVKLILKHCLASGVSVLEVTPKNYDEVYLKVQNGEIGFLVYFDRASDTNDDFFVLNQALQQWGTRMINPLDLMVAASDKAFMHRELEAIGINVPKTLIIEPFDEVPSIEFDPFFFELVNPPFIIKPATETGGGQGVRKAQSVEDILEARKEFPYDRYLVQERIEPAFFGGKKAWFRAFYVLGNVFICWWDDETKIYEMVQEFEINKFGLSEIFNIMWRIHSICKLDFFSSEIAFGGKGDDRKFFVVDYVNEICDMRLKSKAVDGVPDEVVDEIAAKIVEFVRSLK